MSGYEETLYTRAELLDDTGDLAMTAGEILDGAAGAGLDPAAVSGLKTAIRALDPAEGAPGYDAGRSTDRRPGTGFGSDAEFLEAISEAGDQIRDRLNGTGDLQDHAVAALDKAQDDLERGRRDLAAASDALSAAYAMATGTPCDGCHGRKAAAIGEAERAVRDAAQRLQDAARRLALLGDTMELLEELARRLSAALQALRTVPSALGETYELVYQFVARGGKLPRYGRWIEGEA